MLWIGGKVSVMKLIEHLLIPALLTIIVPLLIAKRMPIFSGSFESTEVQKTQKNEGFVLVTGLFLIILVPVFKTVTHLPPYMGMLFSLAIFALIGEVLSKRQLNLSSIDEKNKANHVGPTLKSLSKIEMPSILFFLGILMTVAALETMGLIEQFGENILATGISKELYISILGIGSAIVDNVPLVAASMGMFKDAMDADTWHMIAFAAGTGGSILIIGSAAGVVAMGMEQISFGWYLKRMAPLALIGYLAGIGAIIFLW